MEMSITFPGGKRVQAQAAQHTIMTDQSPEAGGTGSAPEPYLLFLSAIGTCAGIYVLGFCQAREIDTSGIHLTQRMDFDPRTYRLLKVSIDIHLPPSFPEKYREAVRRAADLCAVKKTILAPPEFEVRAVVA